MKPVSPALITATLTGLVTFALIALFFFLPNTSESTNPSRSGLKAQLTDASPKKPTVGKKVNTTAPMDIIRMDTIITRLDDEVEHPRKGFWRFTIEGANVIAVADDEHDRLRILVGVQSAKDLSQAQLVKITQSNFDTALDARYAISQGILWAIYVHPLKSLGNEQFISAIGQTVNLAVSYGGGYSSGGILFDGGDAKDAQRNEMIERLIKKGLKN